jgi:hypothetical protein
MFWIILQNVLFALVIAAGGWFMIGNIHKQLECEDTSAQRRREGKVRASL